MTITIFSSPLGVLLALLLGTGHTAGFCQDRQAWASEQKNVSIPMRDGKSLAADVYLPPRPGKYPCILIQTPYNKKHLGAPISGKGKKAGSTGEVGRGAVSDTLGLLDRDHYAYVVVDWRGFHASRAAKRVVNRRRWRRGQDGYDCVEWCAARPWCNGKIGTWGGSALGKQQFDTAIEQPPHLVCCVPLIAAMGQRYAFYYQGGIPLEAHVKMLDFLGYAVSKKVRQAPLPSARIWKWAAFMTYKPHRITVPCLMISGWWDHYPDEVIRTFEDICSRGGAEARKHSKLLLGPWDHVGVGLTRQGDMAFPGAALESARAAKSYLDHHLRGMKNGWEKTPTVRYWQCGEEKWFSAEKWTDIRREERLLVLRPGRIDFTPGGDEASVLRYTYDPRKPSRTLGGANLPPLKHGPRKQNGLLGRSDILVYRTPSLEEELALNGNAELSFHFSCNRVDCDFTARLCDEDERGNLFLIADAACRAKLRTGKEAFLKPGEVYPITLRFPAHAATFRKGHRLALILSSGNWPRYERNPHTGENFWNRKEAVDVEVTVYHGSRTPAVLRFPERRQVRK